MSESPIYPVSEQWKENAWINQDRYQAMYQQSIENPDQFWAEQAAEFLQWESPWQTVCDYDFAKGAATWFGGALLMLPLTASIVICLSVPIRRR